MSPERRSASIGRSSAVRSSAVRSSAWVFVERGLAFAGAALLLYVCAISLESRLIRQGRQRALDAALASHPLEHQAAPRQALVPNLAAGDLIGSLEIPRLHLTAIVTQGDNDSAFLAGLGHLPDTPFPWEGGNVAVAGHRDTFFRPLRNIATGDRIRLRTTWGEFSYEVRQTMIVDPEDVWVLNATDRPTLTLITCYPFSFIGHAPQRFIVRADQTGHPL